MLQDWNTTPKVFVISGWKAETYITYSIIY